jgi:hypothetical protein
MSPRQGYFEWEHRHQGGFRERGPIRYDAERFEFVLPVLFRPSSRHQLKLGPEDRGGFQSADKRPAQAFSWSFETKALPDVEGAQRPRVIAVEPPLETEVPLYNLVKVRFDRPMDPDWYGIAFEDERRIDDPNLDSPSYNEARHEFELPLMLPANWNGELELVHFRGTDGAPAVPFKLKYRTLRTVMSAELKDNLVQKGNSPELADLINKVADRSRNVQSVAIEVLNSSGPLRAGWSTSYWMYQSEFAKQGSQFLGDTSAIMRIPFRIGSNGNECWFQFKETLTQVPTAEIEQYVSLCDPFGAAKVTDLTNLIADFQLEYLGTTTVDERLCHKLRSWRGVERWWQSARHLGNVTDWYLDAETLLLVQMQSKGTHARFRHTSLNQELPAEWFQPPLAGSLRLQPPEPLDADYTTRYLSVADGSSGVVLSRWGKKGPGGTSSSGLNGNW